MLVLVLVLEMVGTLRRRVLPTAWRGAALACGRRPRDIRSSGPSGQRMSQRAAPANNPGAMHYPMALIRLQPDHRAANRPVARGGRSSATRLDPGSARFPAR